MGFGQSAFGNTGFGSAPLAPPDEPVPEVPAIDTPVAVSLRLAAPSPLREQQTRDVLTAMFAQLTAGQPAPTKAAVEARLLTDGIEATVLSLAPTTADAQHRLVLGPVDFQALPPTTTDATVFDLARGAQQGRMQRANGVWVYELGHAGRVVDFAAVGDTVTLSQTVNVNADPSGFARMKLRVVAPDPRPDGEGDEWLFTAARDGVVFYSRVIPADGFTRELRDVVVPWRGASGSVSVQYALRLLGKVA